MDLIELREKQAEFDHARQALARWRRPSVAPERAGALKTQARRRERLAALETAVARLHKELMHSWTTSETN